MQIGSESETLAQDVFGQQQWVRAIGFGQHDEAREKKRKGVPFSEVP